MNQQENQTSGAELGTTPDTAPAVVLGSGSVNFDNNMIPTAETHASQVVEASAPVADAPTLGNIRSLGQVPVTLKPAAPKATIHTITSSINITLNTGFTLLKGLKELKSVDIERGSEGSEVVEKFNFYNPFVKSDKDRQTGEGLLRKTFASIAEIVHSVLGREAVYLGEAETIGAAIANLVSTVSDKMVAKWPLSADHPVIELEISLDDGVVVPRAIKFGELFSLDSWIVSSDADENCVVTHNAVFNIGLNIGALYDSSEPHVFVRRALTFMESQLADGGLDGLVDYNVNYAFDSTSLENVAVRDLLEILIGEDGYSVVSKAGVENGKVYWAPSGTSNKLFGFGCDVILRSPDVADEGDDEAEEA